MTGTSAKELIEPSLRKICDAAAGRKHTKLRHEAKVHITLCLRRSELGSCSTVSGGLCNLAPLSAHEDTEAAKRWGERLLTGVQALLNKLDEVLAPPPPPQPQAAAAPPERTQAPAAAPTTEQPAGNATAAADPAVGEGAGRKTDEDAGVPADGREASADGTDAPDEAQAKRVSFTEADLENPPAPASPFESHRTTADSTTAPDPDAGVGRRETPDDFPTHITMLDPGLAEANGGAAAAPSSAPAAPPAAHQGTPTLHAAAAQSESPNSPASA